MTKTQLNEQLRNYYLPKLIGMLQDENDVYRIASNKIAIPVVDEERNEKWVTFTVSVPTDETFDGFTEAQFYAEKVKAKIEREAERKAAAVAKQKEAEAKRANNKT